MIAYVVNPGKSGIKLACATLEPSLNPALPGQIRSKLQRLELPLSSPPTLAEAEQIKDQLLALITDWPAPDAVVGRGGLIGKVAAGTYHVTPELAQYALEGEGASHPENLGGLLALKIADNYHVPAFIVDPQSVDEMILEARETGVLGLKRSAEFHALNARQAARQAAYEVGLRFQDARIVVAHLGATTSVTAFELGRAIDTTGTGAGGGPLGAMQSGPLPARMLIQLVNDEGAERTLRLLADKGGFLALAGTANLKALETRIEHDPAVQAIAAAFVHQVCKAIGEQVGALSGRPDAIVVTGGIARWDELADRIERRLAWVAPIFVIPGELELEALAHGAGRVLFGLEPAREWTPIFTTTPNSLNTSSLNTPAVNGPTG